MCIYIISLLLSKTSLVLLLLVAHLVGASPRDVSDPLDRVVARGGLVDAEMLDNDPRDREHEQLKVQRHGRT